MKTNFLSATKIHATLLAALLFGVGASLSRAAVPFPPSPVFTNGVPAWDCLITGPKGERGIMFLTFTTNHDGYGNYAFKMRQIHTKVPTSMPRIAVTVTNSPDPRGGSNSGRGDTATSAVTNQINTTTLTAGTNIYGYVQTSGSWGFDYKGNILGFYVELIIDKISSTNITYLTNQVSFIGKATPNKRFTAIYSSSIGGNGKYSGVPLKPVTNYVNGSDFSGPWTGNEIVGALDTVELFTLFPASMPNAYDITGDGPGYTLDWLPFGAGPLSSKCLISCQKKIAFTDYKFITATNSGNTQRATFGDLKNTTKVAGGFTKGLYQPSMTEAAGTNVIYNAFFVPFIPYP